MSPTRVAMYDTKHGCLRCGKPIYRGTTIEKWRSPHGPERWVHLGCKPALNGQAGPADAVNVADVRDLVREVLSDMDLGQYTGAEHDLAMLESRVKAELIPQLEKALKNVTGTVDDHANRTTDLVKESVAQHFIACNDAVNAKLAELEKHRKVVIEVRRPDGETVQFDEHLHPAFHDVLFHLGCGDNIMLVGPTGCGKTFLGMQIAKALGLEFSFISCSGGLTESAILGMREPNDKGGVTYQVSAFVKAYEEGQLFLWDEVDALDPNVFLSINAALANGKMSVPKRYAKPIAHKHEQHVCLAAANTYGHGADRRYVGRNQLDGASIDRYVCVSMDYDEELEGKLCPDDALLSRLHAYRRKMRENRLERNLSTRFIARAFKWTQAGKDAEYVSRKLFEGWSDNDKRKVQ